MRTWKYRARAAGAARTGAGLIAFGALLAGCSSLLGIEDLNTEPRPGTAGGSGQAGSGGTSGGSGAKGGSAGAPGGRGGSGGSGGANGGAGGTKGGAGGAAGADTAGKAGTGGTTGGSAGRGGSGTSGDGPGPGGEGGMGNPLDPTVHGTIIDFWHHPLPNLPVAIGDVQTVTDQNGEFTIEDVPSEYDVSFIVHRNNPAANYGWVFQGLTRRDPTLQVYKGFDDRESVFTVSQKNGTFTSDSRWLVAFGSDNGASVSSSGENGIEVRPSWQGSGTNEWTVHGIFFERTAELPTSYTAYQSQVVSVSDGDAGHDVEMDLAAQDLDTGTITGTVIQGTGVGRTNSAFVRFTSGAVLPVVDEVDTSVDPYSYLVPQLANSSITIAAAETDYNAGTFAVAHRDGRAVDDTGVDLQIPPSATPVTPAAGSQNVNDATQFAFTGGESGNAGYLVHIEDYYYRQGMYIVTTKKTFKLGDFPVVGGAYKLMPDELHTWLVETHGKFASTDAMTGPNGYLDEFSLDMSRPKGPAHKDGSFTQSGMYGFTTAP